MGGKAASINNRLFALRALVYSIKISCRSSRCPQENNRLLSCSPFHGRRQWRRINFLDVAAFARTAYNKWNGPAMVETSRAVRNRKIEGTVSMAIISHVEPIFVPCSIKVASFWSGQRCYFCNHDVSKYELALPYSPGCQINFCSHCLLKISWLPENDGLLPLKAWSLPKIPMAWFIDESIRWALSESYRVHGGW